MNSRIAPTALIVNERLAADLGVLAEGEGRAVDVVR